MTTRMRVLVVLSSSNQMYSGIGRAVFAFARGMSEWVDFEIAIDDATPKNTELVVRFGREHGVPVHVGAGYSRPDALDRANADLPAVLRRRRWDAVECLCWANTATNEVLLDQLDPNVTLAYTPHDQPTWTVAMSDEQAARVTAVHNNLLRRADVVFCDSPVERSTLQAIVPHRNTLTFLPLGCDFQAYRPAPWPRREQLLFVGDLAEPRKRFDRVLKVLARLASARPNLRLKVVGNRSDEVTGIIPAELRSRCDLHGYIDEEELRHAYAESSGLFLLSEFEAFGIPILEALATATPVFLSEQETTRSIFGSFAGAHFCPGDDVDATASIVEHVLARGRHSVTEIAAERRRLKATHGWEELSHRKWRALASAWSRRTAWSVPA
jgi:glycosyltransferase involved in cell wall biosynthesis